MLSIKFYGSSLAAARRRRVRSPGMSNGCRGIACRFTHEANFPAYRDAIFLLPPSLRPLFRREHHRAALISPLRSFLHKFFTHSLSLHARPDESALSCAGSEFGCLRCTVTWLLVSALGRA